MIDFFYQVMVIILLSVVVGLLIIFIGGLGLQHQSLFNNIANITNITERQNLLDRAHSDNLTRMVIINVTGESSNSTNAILGNITTHIDLTGELLNSKIDRAMGVAVRTHNDVQQVLHLLLNMTNSTGHIIDILPDFK